MNEYLYTELIDINVKNWNNVQSMAKFYNKKYDSRLSLYDLLITMQQRGPSFQKTFFWMTLCPNSSAEIWKKLNINGWLRENTFLMANEIRICFCLKIDLGNDKFPNRCLLAPIDQNLYHQRNSVPKKN